MDFDAAQVGGVDVKNFLVAHVSEGFVELRVKVIVYVEDGGARSVPRKVVIAVFFADEESELLAGVVRGGEIDGGVGEAVFSEIVSLLAGNVGELCVLHRGEQAVNGILIGAGVSR